jgi:hypothetical protein
MNVRKTFDASLEIAVHSVEVNREQSVFVAACEDGFRGMYMAKNMREIHLTASSLRYRHMQLAMLP